MTETSVAEAKNHLPRLIHRVEAGDAVHITRRGKPVAVLLSEAAYARLCATRARRGFWDHIVEMRADPEFDPVDLAAEEIDSWRDSGQERDFQWPD